MYVKDKRKPHIKYFCNFDLKNLKDLNTRYIFQLVILSMFTCSTVYLSAQDAGFTQFYASPLFINPAMAGSFNGSYRVGILYRDQYRSALDRPFKTFTASGDVKFAFGNVKEKNPDLFALGIMFYSDRIGIFDLNTTSIAVSGAFHKSLNKKKNQYLSGGIQFNLSHKSLNYEDLFFQDQFNSIDGYTLASGEFLPVNNFGYGNLGLGLNHSISPNRRTSFSVGIAAFNLLNQNISFFEKQDITNPNIQLDVFLKPKIVFNAAASFQAADFVYIDPRVLYSQQGDLQQLTLVNLFKYKLPRSEGKTFYGGPGLKFANNTVNTGIESIIITGGFEYKGLLIGLSYDHNLSSFQAGRTGLSSFEFSIIYLGDYENSDAFCPTF